MRTVTYAVRRVRPRAPVLLVAMGVVFLAVGLLAVVTAYFSVVTQEGVRDALRGEDPERLVTVATQRVTVAELDEVATAAPRQIDATLGAGNEQWSAVLSDSFGLVGRAEDEQTRLVSYDDPARIATLAEGTWPNGQVSDAMPAALPIRAAQALGIGIGDTLTVRPLVGSETADLTFHIVGLYEPQATAALPAGVEQAGFAQSDFRTYGPVLLDRAALLDAVGGGRVTARWRVLPNLDAVGPDELRSTARDIEILTSTEATSGNDSVLRATSTLPRVLRAIDEKVAAARAEVALPGIALSVLSGVTLVVVAGVVADATRRERTVLRARGASRAQLVGLGLTDALLVSLPAVVITPVVATALVARLSGVPFAAPAASTWLIALTAALCCVLVLAAPAARTPTLTEEGAAESRPSRRSGLARAGLDLAVLAVAAVTLWQLRSGSDARFDIALVAAPALGVLAGALLVPRLLSRLAQLVERRTARRRGLGAALAARELGRRPRQHAGTAVLLATALGVGVLTLVYDRSWVVTAQQQVTARTGADIRVQLPAPEPAGLARVPGVQSTMAVAHASGQIGSESVDLLLIDAANYPPGDAGLASLGARADGPVPVVVNKAAARAIAIGTDAPVSLHVGPLEIDLLAAEIRQNLPTVDAARGTVIVDRRWLQHALLAAAEALPPPPPVPPGFPTQPTGAELVPDLPAQEFWLTAVEGADTSTVSAALRAEHPQATVLDQAALSERLRTDPLTSGGRNAGLLAVGAAAVLAVVGFAGQVLVGGHRRAPDLAVIRALGQRRRASVRAHAGEQTALAALSVVAGTVCGVVVALVSMPSLVRTPTLVPGELSTDIGVPAVVGIPWPTLAIVVVAGLLVLAVVARVFASLAQRERAAIVLREQDDR